MAEKESRQSRRDFLQVFTRGAPLGLALFGAAAVFVRNVLAYLFPERKVKKYHRYLVAREGEIPLGQAKRLIIGGKPVFVVHLEDGYKVFSGICTHLGCIVRWEKEKERFYCPCHKGVFNKRGEVVSGPPPEPLVPFRVERESGLVFMYVEEKIKGPWS